MKIKKGSLSHIILSGIKKASDSGALEMFSYSSQMQYLRSKANLSAPQKSYLSKYIKRFVDKGLLEYEKDIEGKSALKLTTLGKEYLGMEGEWDGKYRIVVWDIPEKKRRLRDLLRRKLKEWKFKSLQKSVWVSKRNVTVRLRKLINELEMGEWVIVIESDDPFLADIKFHDRGI